eukprot:359882-Chlamydomonas_euryale.AAC.5
MKRRLAAPPTLHVLDGPAPVRCQVKLSVRDRLADKPNGKYGECASSVETEERGNGEGQHRVEE